MTFYQAILASFIAAICAGTVTWFIHRRFSHLADFIARGRIGRQIPKNLQRYLNHLSKRTLQIAHPWMKEDQTLGDILVPVGVLLEDGRTDLRAFIAARFHGAEMPRIVIVGSPGSGKSIALGDIARYLLTLDRPQPLAPVLVTFSDLKGKSSKSDMEEVIADKLRLDQFTDAKPDQDVPAQFIADNLYAGNIVLLIDGYDELDRDQRAATARFVREFLTAYRKIPAVLSSRTAVYEREQSFREIATYECVMAPLSPLAINRFVSQWRFDQGKSSAELLDHIIGKAHLNELASNPLMLTIICFLYAQPKYLLPDNRVEFYRECCRALLEKWDLALNAARANQFSSDHKMDVLSRIAYRHVSNSAVTDEEISVGDAHEITRKALQALSLNQSLDGQILREVVDNSGLLIELPPDSYRFPHRTFLEFFAASYLYEQEPVEQLLKMYTTDEPRWRPTLLMYAGLCRNRETTATLLNQLTESFARSTATGPEPDVTVFSALIETNFAAPETAAQVLTLAEDYLNQQGPRQVLIDELGYIAANTKRIYSVRARHILRSLLTGQLAGPMLQTVMMAAMRCKEDEEIKTLIAQRLGELDLAEVFMQAGRQAAYYLNRLLEMGMAPSKKQQLVDGLREGGHLGLLADMMVESADPDLAARAGLALFISSEGSAFTDFLDGHETKQFGRELNRYVDDRLTTWGWPLLSPKTEAGRNLAVAIAYHTANSISQTGEDGQEIKGASWLAFLTRLVLAQTRAKYQCEVFPRFEKFIPLGVLERVWTTCPWKGNAWNRFCRLAKTGADIDSAGILVISCWILSALADLSALIVLSTRLLTRHAGLVMPAWLVFASVPDIVATLTIFFVALSMGLITFLRNRDADIFFFTAANVCLIIMSIAACFEQIGDRINLKFRLWDISQPYRWNVVKFFRISFSILVVLSIVVWKSGLGIFATLLVTNAVLILFLPEQSLLVRVALFGGLENYRVGQLIWESSTAEAKEGSRSDAQVLSTGLSARGLTTVRPPSAV